MASNEPVEYDVVIIGGGIAGLYTAWRLANSTNLKILVLEATNRLGGRFLTCEMPGGFCADMGAMRYSSTCNPILQALIDKLNVSTYTLIQNPTTKNKFSSFFRNKHMSSMEEMREMFSISDEDLPYARAAFSLFFGPSEKGFDFMSSGDGNFGTAVDKLTGQKAQDMSLASFLLQSNNPQLLGLADSLYPPPEWTVALASGFLNTLSKNWSEVKMVEGGYEKIITVIASVLSKYENVEIKLGKRVKSVMEDHNTFTVKLDDGLSYSCKKVFFACSYVGMKSITLEQQERQAKFQEMMNKVDMLPNVKVFLTYSRAWWEDNGMYEGTVATDWPNRYVVLFGEKSKTDSFATILASFKSTNSKLYLDLDIESNERFVNTAGKVPSELVPSKLLVQQVHTGLKRILGCPDLEEEPVCAARMFWGTKTYAGSTSHPRCGVDSNALHWESLKPFDDSDMFITSDVFAAWDKNGANVGFADISLLTTERILANHFGLEPIIPGLCLQNPWPST
ncbi:probable flavin-containing monoamine oxidase B [Watersipora subatra]|uniref:probable flavin-containing monoamine oxidase B n=1 Tax=Watersipora subatra TaxID=2589382 RepID=UPI00355B1B45